MRDYDQDEYEEYYDYEEEGYGQEEEGEEEEYEEEEVRKPTAEEQEYLELRARIKEQIRKKMQRENGATSKSQDIKKKSHVDNYGSFFGPSQPVIAQRVIQESKSLLENPHLVFRNSNSHNNKKTSSSSTGSGSKNRAHEQVPKFRNEVKSKVQKIKATRDYSFLLSDDAELPAPTKQPVLQHVSAPIPEARTAQMPQKSKHLSSNGVRDIRGGRDERRPISMNGQMHSKSVPNKSTSISKPSSSSIDSRRQLQSNNGTGPGRPMASTDSRRQLQSSNGTGPGRPMASTDSRRQLQSSNATGPGLSMVTKGLPPKAPHNNVEKASASGGKSILPAARKPLLSKVPSSVPRQPVEQKRVLQEPKNIVSAQRPSVASSRPQVSKPVKQLSSRSTLQDNRPKKRPVRPFAGEDDEDAKALSMIRKMFKYDRFAGRDDEDDLSDMEANFDDIMEEERRSAKIAKKEDEEQLRLIEEEEKRERMRKQAKKRKLSRQ